MERKHEVYIMLFFGELQPRDLPIGKCDHDNYCCNKSECLKYWVNYKHIYLNTVDTELLMKLVKYNKTATIYYWTAIKINGYDMHTVRLPKTTKTLFAYTRKEKLGTI